MIQNSSLLAQKAAQEPAAFSDLYEQYFARVYNYIRCRCFEAGTADDLTSQVFERLLECIHQYRPERGPFEPWLFAIVRNVVNGHFRKNRALWESIDVLHRQPPGGPAVEEAVIERETCDEMLKAMARLDERSRDVLSLKFAAGLNNRQIASLLKLSESNIGVIVYRALGNLRQVLGTEGQGKQDGWDAREQGYERA